MPVHLYFHNFLLKILETHTLLHLFVFLCQDFDVGKSYKKKILLTNISYTQNYCKYVGMSHLLKDFIEVL